MSQNLVVNFIGENKLSKTTTVAARDLRKFERTAKSVGNSVNKSLGALGLGLGLATLTNGLKNATKAASDDRKSQGLLAQALKNTVGATAGAIAGAESYIKKTQLQTAVLDDELRPALATAVRATGSLAGGQKVLDTALNVSAGTGKDLGTVTNALAKAYNGNTASLKKLLPSIKTGGDFMAQLDKQFKGAAETAANLDPYKRLEVIFNDIQEQIGTALLPALEEFSAYLSSPEGQKNLQQIVALFVQMGKAIVEVSKFIVNNISLVKAMVGVIITLKIGWMATNAVVGLYTAGVISATTATKALRTALITTGIGAVIVGLGFLAEGWINASEAQDQYDPNLPLPDSSIPPVFTGTDPGAYSRLYEERRQARIREINATADAIKKALKAKIDEIRKTAESFRDAVGLAFGTFGKDENSVFNVDVVINKLKRVVDAAKGFAQNINKLRKAGASEDVIAEITGMGPAQGNIVAKGLLQSGKLSEYLGLRKSLYNTGASVGAEAAITGDATYNIKVEGTALKASDIIREIQKYEKANGRKYLLNG
jgi:hypothetical protein